MKVKDTEAKILHKIGDFYYTEDLDGTVERIREASNEQTITLMNKLFTDKDQRERVRTYGKS